MADLIINKAVLIEIKNVNGDPDNEGLISELTRAGAGTGTKHKGFHYIPNNTVQFDSHSYHCTAYVGETCEIIKEY